MSDPIMRYLTSDYLKNNPSWDCEDSIWKSKKIFSLLRDNGISPTSFCEVGCGAGGCLAGLREHFAVAEMFGFDIAPDVVPFWDRHKEENIIFKLGDFFELNERYYDVILILDVVEHVANMFEFLNRLRGNGSYYIFHFPLDLSAVNVLREEPLLNSRKKVGHLHNFTKGLALSLLTECEFRVVEWRYTSAAFSAPKKSFRTQIAKIPRKLAYIVNRDFGVRMFGGETLLVLAKENSAAL